MASQMLPLYINPDNDKELLEWLKKKTNRSAFMRNILYDRMILEKRGQIIPPQFTSNNNSTNTELLVTERQNDKHISEVDDNFQNSMAKFANFKFKK